MLNPYYSFFVGKGAPSTTTTIDTMNIGEIAIAYVNSGALTLPTASTTGVGGKDFYILQVIDKKASKSIYRLSPLLNQSMIANVKGQVVRTPNQSYTPQQYKITFTSIDITKGYTYVLLMHFYNVRDLSPQVFYMPFYVQVPLTGTLMTAKEMAAAFVAQLNRDEYQKVEAWVDGTTDTIIHVRAITPDYVITQRDEFCPLYFEVGFGELSIPKYVAGTIPTKTKVVIDQETPTNLGIGDWRIVSDQEKRAQARMGIMNWTAFPVTLPRMFTKESMPYTKYDITFSTPYRAADDTINRLTNESVVIYVESPDVTSATDKKAPGAITESGLLKTCLPLFCPDVKGGTWS